MTKVIKMLVFVSLISAVLLFSVSCGSLLGTDSSAKDTDATGKQSTPVETPSETPEETTEPDITTPCAHTWSDATCLTPKTCSACGATDGIALGHDIVIDEAKDPTCEEPGLTAGQHCSRCNDETVAQNAIDPLGHKAGAEATCTTDQTCIRCKHVFVKALEHNIVIDEAKSPDAC